MHFGVPHEINTDQHIFCYAQFVLINVGLTSQDTADF